MELLYFLIFWLITGLSYFREDYNGFVKGHAYIFVCSIMFPLLHIATAATVLYYAKTNSTIRYFAIMVFELAAFMMGIVLFQHYSHYRYISLDSIFYLIYIYSHIYLVDPRWTVNLLVRETIIFGYLLAVQEISYFLPKKEEVRPLPQIA